MTEPIFYRVPDALGATGLTRSTFYELVRKGEISIVKLGTRTLVPAESLRQWASRLERASRDRA